jgi:hypothetical protein
MSAPVLKNDFGIFSAFAGKSGLERDASSPDGFDSPRDKSESTCIALFPWPAVEKAMF